MCRTLSASTRILNFYLLDDWKPLMCFEQVVALAKRQIWKINVIPGGVDGQDQRGTREKSVPSPVGGVRLWPRSSGRNDKEGRPERPAGMNDPLEVHRGPLA